MNNKENKLIPSLLIALGSALFIAIFHYVSTSIFSSLLLSTLAIASICFLLIFAIAKHKQPKTAHDLEETPQQSSNHFTILVKKLAAKPVSWPLTQLKLAFF